MVVITLLFYPVVKPACKKKFPLLNEVLLAFLQYCKRFILNFSLANSVLKANITLVYTLTHSEDSLMLLYEHQRGYMYIL